MPYIRHMTEAAPELSIPEWTIGDRMRKARERAHVSVQTIADAHGLRRTCASDVLDRGANIRQLQELLGHSRLSSTERYLRRSNARDLRPVVEGRIYQGAAAS